MNNLEVRSTAVTVDGHSLRTVVPFGEFVDGGRSCRLSSGALARSVTERGGKLRLFCDDRIVGRCIELVERDDGLHVSFELDSTASGDAALRFARSGGTRLLALLRPIRNVRDQDVDVVHEAALMRFDLDGFRPAAAHRVISRSAAERRLALLDM